jgi:F0F1-type ATP synthase epsilon subunit
MDFEVIIVSPKGKWQGKVSSLTMPGQDGELTIRGDHASIFGRLKEGKIRAGSYQQDIGGGFFEFIDNQVRIAVDEE